MSSRVHLIPYWYHTIMICVFHIHIMYHVFQCHEYGPYISSLSKITLLILEKNIFNWLIDDI